MVQFQRRERPDAPDIAEGEIAEDKLVQIGHAVFGGEVAGHSIAATSTEVGHQQLHIGSGIVQGLLPHSTGYPGPLAVFVLALVEDGAFGIVRHSG